jgi:DNA-directed RNA polymerase beta' subunit
MTKSTNLQTLLKTAQPEVRKYVAELEAENLKLQKQVAKFQVKEVSSKNRITALEIEIKKQGSGAIAKLLKEIDGKSRGLPVKPA